MKIFQFSFANNFRWDASNDRIRRNVFADDCASSNNCTLSYPNSWLNDHSWSNKNIVTTHYAFRDKHHSLNHFDLSRQLLLICCNPKQHNHRDGLNKHMVRPNLLHRVHYYLHPCRKDLRIL